jgi:hypothetical protein
MSHHNLLAESTDIGACRVLGERYVGFQHVSGSRFVMPEAVIPMLSQQSGLSKQIGRVANFAAEHNGYHLPELIADEHDLTILKSPQGDDPNAPPGIATIYRSRDRHVVIKAFDKSLKLREATLQFATMNALRHSLAEAKIDDYARVRLHAPVQYAIIQPPVGRHRTILMENVRGLPLRNILHRYLTSPERTLNSPPIPGAVREIIGPTLRRQVNPRILKYANDVTRSFANTLVPAVPAHMPQTEEELVMMLNDVTIIDQPHYQGFSLWDGMGWRDGVKKIDRLLNRGRSMKH